ncbi:hybrid sensor histidine kinase/response regulator transcription factor [Sphingobacterium arenae]|uniref:histidine kinase n=1 Tax=Sphingobacterium arenae TaxID=1280598 RepID=A0ABR7Y2A1_9SPHI|nr:hybrid sensor histidine kinase/response regulator transcription factor [Sphingobacterium arenae]MBD1425433.1 response regulator [Sphingobacterium arenae]
MLLGKFQLLLVLFLLGWGISFSQPKQYKILSLEQGISNINALSVVQDDQGFIWVATELGLNRFSGNSFKHYYKSEQLDGSSVNSNEINKLLYDDGHIYIGTRANGLNIFDIQKGVFSYFTHDPDDQNAIATNDITDMIKGIDGHIWLSTYHRGIQRFDIATQTFTHFGTETIPDLPSNSIWSVAQDQQGKLYSGHVNHGVSIFDAKTGKLENLHTQNTAGALPHNEVKILFCDSRNNIWIGTKKGLAVYTPHNKKIRHVPLHSTIGSANEPFVHTIREIGEDIWVGTEPSRVYVLTPHYNRDQEFLYVDNVRSVDISNSISVQDMIVDEFGNVWLALYGSGLGFASHFTPFFQTLPDLKAVVSGIVIDRQNTGWFITEGSGLLRWVADKNLVEEVKAPDNIRDHTFLTAYQDRQDNIWLGLVDKGVTRFHTPTKQWYKIELDGELNEVRAILEDQNGKIWLGTINGLVIYDPLSQTFEKLRINIPSLGDYAPRSLVEDSSGNIWVGTYGQGVYVFSAENRTLIAHFDTHSGLRSNSINHLFRDSENNIWIATNEGMAVQYAKQELGTLNNIIPPKPNAWLFIQAIAEDRNGNIWCSTKAGLLRYVPKDNRFFSYDQDFGIPLGGFKNSSVATNKQHYLFFGMQNGICFFDPKEIPIQLPISPLHIRKFTTFRSGDSPLQEEKQTYGIQQLRLSYQENSFSIEFSAADYALHGLMEFSYQLQGFDSDWTNIGGEQVLNFRNIPYGNYDLLIRARLKNENWSGDVTRLSINITPPYYLSLYAKALYILMASGIAFAIIFFYHRKIKAEGELRLKKREHQQQQQLATERLHFFTNITHELRTPLTLILGPLDDLLRENNLSTKQKKLVQVVQKSSNRLFNLVNQLLEFRKVESRHKPLVLGEGYLGEVVQDLVHKYMELNVKDTLQIRCKLPSPDLRTTFDAEIIHIILDNLLSNAYKYTNTGAIDVQLTYEQDQLNTWSVLRVKDTGCGIPEEYLERIYDRFFQIDHQAQPGTGIGLAMVKELVAVHYGKIDIKSKVGEGTEFCVRLLTNHIEITPQHEKMADDTIHLENEDSQPVILIVEDDVDLRNYIVASLETHYTVLLANNGIQGLDAATKHIPDLIISDVMMTGLDGFEMVGKLKENRSTSHIPIILFTAKDQEIDRQRGYELGVDSYLIKPVHAALLHKRIENILSNRKNIHNYVLQKLPSKTAKPTNELDTDLWKENTFVQEFVEIVERYMQDDVLDAAKLAEKMNMSQSTLYRKLKALTGKNINQLVRKIRIQKAATLLQSGRYNITEASFMVGIHSTIYFRQCFKEEFGLLPSEYLKNASESK